MKKHSIKLILPIVLLVAGIFIVGPGCNPPSSCSNTWYQDADGDGYGNPDEKVEACNPPAGYVEDNTDCDDTNDTVYPDAPELCDGYDNNCDGEVDNNTTDCYANTICVDGVCVAEASCDAGISYLHDGNLVSFDDSLVTGEIWNDAAIGKFYDIWTDENGGFYYHSTITETGETCGFAADWFTTDDVANIIFLNNKDNVSMTFTIVEGASVVGDQVTIEFSGSYDENGTTHQITQGVICTQIDIVH